ncbi:unnamed protein product [Strongylus vulgaris]|uniref:Kazal-like domain-containing protein n=1 Tax=Strongylus vulgaris TaxID=40348 RepID=A0A3P7L5N4_STRVU|nr:unnamed protein product [Strongylus vulgaris]
MKYAYCRFERLNCLLRKSGKPEILLQHYGKCRQEIVATVLPEDLADTTEGSGLATKKEIAIENDSKEIQPSSDAKLQQGTQDRRAVKARAIPSLFLDDVDILAHSERLDQSETFINSFERDLPVVPSSNGDVIYPATINDDVLSKLRLPSITEASEEAEPKSADITIPPAISVSAILQPFDLTQPCSAAECDKTRNPVCDSNNRTHKNMCLFKFFACKVHRLDGTVIELSHMGECTADAKTPDSTCPPCPVSTSDTLVCDNLNKTHDSLCAFARFNCMQRVLKEDERVLIHIGRCHNRSLGFTLKDEKCPVKCSSEQHPVCDTQGNTHMNLCQFQKTNCLLRKKGRPAPMLFELKSCSDFVNASNSLRHSGEIIPKESVPPLTSTEISEKGQADAANTTQRATFDCPQPSCGSEGLPVCDSQGIMHENVCMFLHARCLAAKEGINLSTQPEENCLKIMCDKDCPKEEKPVCGSNFVTYKNLCHFNKQRCKDDSMSLLFYGKCEECLPTPCPPIQEDAPDEVFVCDEEGFTRTICEYQMLSCIVERSLGVNISIQHGQCCNRRCEETHAPVCDGTKTYENMCKFKIAQCEAERKGEVLTLAYAGECCTLPKGKCERSGSVCDSDGQTHIDVCHFQQKRCVMNKSIKKSLTVVHSGECCTIEACHKGDSAPVCDTHGGTHATKCHFQNTKCIHDKMHPDNPINLDYTGIDVSSNTKPAKGEKG